MTADSNWFTTGAAAVRARGRAAIEPPELSPPDRPAPMDGGPREASAPAGPRPGGDADWVRAAIESHRARGGLR